MMTRTAGLERVCPECDSVMTVVHRGQFSTLHVCPTCGSTLTIPPPVPLLLRKAPSD
jgi:predicted RNA-binding Zn-ribbon protein involved in translation (DUF1610 family)